MVKDLPIKFVFLLAVFTLNIFLAGAQDNSMDNQLQQLKLLSRDSLIERAVQLISHPIQKENFDIKVMANATDIVVSFRTPIKFVPMNSISYYDIGVILTGNQTSYNSVANPQDYLTKESISIFTPTEHGAKHINFVIQAINNSDKVGSLERDNFKDNMVIRDQKDHYEVLVISKNQESWYHVSKKDGSIFDYGHAHFADYPFVDEEPQDPYVEIKE